MSKEYLQKRGKGGIRDALPPIVPTPMFIKTYI